MASKSITKVAKSSSNASKADQKRSGKAHEHHEAVNPYATEALQDEDYVEGGNLVSFINFQSKDLSFDDFLDVMNDKHQRDAAVECLLSRKLKSYNVQQPPITPAMADQLLGGIRSAMGLGAGAGKKGGKKTSSDGVPSPSVAAARTVAVQCGTALVVCCGAESKQLSDEWGATLMTTVTGIIKGVRSQMEDYVHTSNIQEGPVKMVIASPSGITSNASAAQRKALSEIAGKCTNLLVKCFEGLALLYSLDPSMSVNEEHESLPVALLKLATLVIPENNTASQLNDSFPTAGNENAFYLPVEASGSLLVCLASCCEPAQGPKTRAAILRLHRFVTGSTVTVQTEDEDADTATNESLESGDHKTNYMGLVSTIIVTLVQAMGILATRFPDMIAPDTDVSAQSTPTGPSPFTSTPLLSVDLHLLPLSILVKSKAMAKGRGRRETQSLLRLAAKKLGSINGSNIDSIEEHQNRHHRRPAAVEGSPTTGKVNNKFPVVSPPRERNSDDLGSDDLPSENPNRAAAREEEDAEEEEQLNATEASAQVFDGADPVEVIQFRDNLSVKFIGFPHIYLSSCLRAITADGLQRQLAQNPAVRAALNVTEDLNRKLEKGERREQLLEAEASKIEEQRDRKKERDRKAMARDYTADTY